jgi:plasminogen activator inhibitor 1 RNA-binding protein
MSNKNMFALLNDSDSDDDAPKQQKAAAPAPAKQERKPERKPDRKPRNDRPRDQEDRGPYDGGDKVLNPADDRKQGKGERRGKGKGKGGSRGDSGREYPRRSGTGRGREGNRGGGGKYNWGKDTDTTAAPAAEGAEGAEAAAEAAAAPVVEAEPIEEEEPTMSFEEYEKAQADKMAALNSLNKYEEVTVKADDDVVTKAEESIEDEYACMFHDPSKTKKDYGKKGARDGYKQADQVLNLKFVDENEGGGKGKGGKGDRRQGGKGRQGGKVMAPRDNTSGGKANIDLSNDMAFPTLGV